MFTKFIHFFVSNDDGGNTATIETPTTTTNLKQEPQETQEPTQDTKIEPKPRKSQKTPQQQDEKKRKEIEAYFANPENIKELKNDEFITATDGDIAKLKEVALRTLLNPAMRELYILRNKDKKYIFISRDGDRILASRQEEYE